MLFSEAQWLERGSAHKPNGLVPCDAKPLAIMLQKELLARIVRSRSAITFKETTLDRTTTTSTPPPKPPKPSPLMSKPPPSFLTPPDPHPRRRENHHAFRPPKGDGLAPCERSEVGRSSVWSDRTTGAARLRWGAGAKNSQEAQREVRRVSGRQGVRQVVLGVLLAWACNHGF